MPEKKCGCAEMSCQTDCSGLHTHKEFFCEICRPPDHKLPKEPDHKLPKEVEERFRDQFVKLFHITEHDPRSYSGLGVQVDGVWSQIQQFLAQELERARQEGKAEAYGYAAEVLRKLLADYEGPISGR